MADRPLAEAVGDLRLDDGKFTRDLALIRRRLLQAVKELEQQAKVGISVKVDLSDVRRQIAAELARLTPTGAGVTIPVHANTTSAAVEIGATKAAAEATPINLPVGADTTSAAAALAELRTSLNAFDQVRLQIDVQNDQVLQAQQSLQRLAVLAQSVEDDRIIIDADLRDAGVRQELARLSTLIAAVTNQPANIDIDMDAAQALSQLGALAAAVSALDDRNIELNLDIDGLARASAQVVAIDEAANAAATRGGLGALARTLGFLAVGGVAAIGAAGAAITVMGVQSAAALEGTIKSFENILGSAEQAQTLFKELQAFAIPSPFDTQVLANTARQLLAIQIPAEEVVGTVKDLGAVVALLGNSSPEAFGRLTLALGQINTSMKPLTQDLRQITSTLPGFNTEMQLAEGVAAKFGVSLQEAQDKIKDGAITGADAVQILLQRMREFPGVAGSIAAAAETLQGKIAAFTDTIKVNLINSFTGVSELVRQSLDPLGANIDVALKAIGPALARSFEQVIPTLIPLVDDIGVALAPAFEGIFTGLGDAASGLAPVIVELLPLVGELAETLGRMVAALGPAAGDIGRTLGQVLVPALDALADVLDAIPPSAISGLVTAFLAFKTVSGVASLIDGITASLRRFTPAAAGAATASTTAATGMQRFGTAASVAGIAAAAGLATLSASAEDTTTQLVGMASTLGLIATGFAVGGPWGGAFAVGAAAIGGIIGKLQEGKREAEEFDNAVRSLADALTNVLPQATTGEVFTLEPTDIIGTSAFQDQITQVLGEDLRNKLVDEFGITRARLNELLRTMSREQLEAFFREQFARSSGDVATSSFRFADEIERIGSLADLATEAIGKMQDAARFEGRTGDTWVSALLSDIERVRDRGQSLVAGEENRFRALQDITRGARAEAEAAQKAADEALQAAVDSILQNLDEIAKAQFEKEMVAALERVEEAASALDQTFQHLNGTLNLTTARQNLNRDIAGLSDALRGMFDDEGFEQAQREAEGLTESIANQRQRIADLRVAVARETADAQAQARDLESRIQEARAEGAVQGAAALEAERGRIFRGVEDAQRDLDRALTELADLEGRLSSIDLSTPGGILDTVRAQAAQAGVKLFDFILAGPTPEARSLYQELLAQVFSDAASTIQRTAELEGPEAAIKITETLATNLRNELQAGGLDFATADEIVDALLKPDELVAEMTEVILAGIEQASVDALKDGAKVVVPFDADISAIELKLTQIEGRPIRIKAEIDNPNQATLPANASREQLIQFLAGLADGGIVEFYRNGGIRRPSAEPPHMATILPAGTWRVMAEPETGGEGYIPLGVHKRAQGLPVLSTIADLFGFKLAPKNPPVEILPVIAPQLPRSDVATLTAAVDKLAARLDSSDPMSAAYRQARAAEHDRPPIHIEELHLSGYDKPRKAAKDFMREMVEQELRR